MEPVTRWVIEPFGKVQFRVRFLSKVEGKFDAALGFEVVGSAQQFTLFCVGKCEVPQINNNTQNIFMKRVKAHHAGTPLPIRRHVIAEDFYSFGPILSFKQAAWRLEPTETSTETDIVNHNLVKNTNSDIMRLTNTGKYPCKVELGFEKREEDIKDVFLVEPFEVSLEEGETKEVKIWAFPPVPSQRYQNTLIACVSNNPRPLRFNMECSGVEPSIVLKGPWLEALAEAEAAAAVFVLDPKDKTSASQLEELNKKVASLQEYLLLDFDRILIGKTDFRSFTIQNTCHLPVAWQVGLGDFADSQTVIISPRDGVLAVGATTTIMVTFCSRDALLIDGQFSLKYSDTEDGLLSIDRVGTKVFRVVAEAYFIKTVSLTAEGQEPGGDEIDFGISRVGDISHQIVKINNRGKYKISYKIHIKKPSVAALVQVDPTDGEIDTGGTAEFKVTFCSAKGEVLLKANKDIRVQVFEPTEGLLGSGEMVEDFPLFISAQAVYSKFRMQPSRGVQFGAQRYDSEAKTKRVELRNEGKFEFCYVICAASSEESEIDALDYSAFSTYSYGVPAAVRHKILGDNYKQRITDGPGAGAAAATGKAAPAKGAKGAPATSASVVSSSPWNELGTCSVLAQQ